MAEREKINILLVDDQPAKLMTYEVILEGLGETLIAASSAREALDRLLRFDIAVVLMDVSMPELDGFELASMVREHPRYRDTAIIFVSAVHLTEADYVRGYKMGAVDYVSSPVIPEVLRAKVKVFADLHRKKRELEVLNGQLEERVKDRTEQLRLSNDRLTMLAREVDHRAKNALAVAQAIVRLSQADSIEKYVVAIEGRIGALARAHTLLSDSRWEGANLRTIAEEELAPYRDSDASHISIIGPDLILRPVCAQAIGLALHELATNAAKYGAFASPSGSLSLTWTLSEPLRISWQESGAAGLRPPERSGFGTKVIELTIGSQLGGQVQFEWLDGGLHCTIEMPHASDRPVVQARTPKAGDTDQMILLVEDEPLVAAMIEKQLHSLGYQVAGPYSGLSEALAATNGSYFAAAILDINLKGDLVFPLADILLERKIPFVFTTGYGPERVETRFARIPVLLKPVEAHTLEEFLKETISE